MQVILQEDIPSVGSVGDIVKVAAGFARNYLFPKKKAIVASPSNLLRLEHAKKTVEKKKAAQKRAAEELQQKIGSLSLSIKKQAGEENKIFGSVTTHDVQEVLKAQSVSVEKKYIQIVEPIRELGEHTVSIRLHNEVTAQVRILVERL